MRRKSLITVMVGVFFLLFLSSFAEATPGGVTECTNNLNTCNTNLALCTTNLTNAQTNYGTCNTNLGACQTNLGTCQTNAETSLSACQTNLATCQETVAQCSQKTSLPSWDKKLPCDTSNCPRFEVLADWGNAAVLDKETGLVWEQSPSTIAIFNWYNAQYHCINLVVGGRIGWRIPTVQELASLVDPTQAIGALPAGHPFSNVQEFDYWSASTVAANTNLAWYMNLYFVFGGAGAGNKDDPLHVWCVRGGQGVDTQ